MFGCDRSIIKGTLLGKQRIFCGVSQRLLEAFAYNFITRTPHSFPTNGVKFGSDRTIMRGTILVKKK